MENAQPKIDPETEQQHEPPFTEPYLVIDNFLPIELAEAMRQSIDNHFNKPYEHDNDVNAYQVWNYWYVPNSYTYLRTQAEKIIGWDNHNKMQDRLKNWSTERLGMDWLNTPYLSMYIDGCRQTLHTDTFNGRFGYVYSLTRNDRLTTGGNTMIMKEGDPLRSYLGKSGARASFYHLVEPVFNRFIMFDDRLPHAVEMVEGSMDPLEGRFVIHGHISPTGININGPLDREAVELILGGVVQPFKQKCEGHNGPLMLRMNVDISGYVVDCRVLVDRVASATSPQAEWEQWKQEFIQSICKLRFHPSPTGSEITLPVLFGAILKSETI